MKGLALAQRAFDTPLAIEPAKAEIIARVLGNWVRGGPLEMIEAAEDAEAGRPRLLYERAGPVAVIEVIGTLVNRGGWIGAQSGITSYEGLRRQIEAAAADPAVAAIALEIDSPGGEVRGLFDFCAALRAARAVKPVHAFLADQATSAAYAIAAQADRVTISGTGWAGHIGAIIVHADMSGALAREGLAVTLIHSGARKADGTDLAPLSDEARAWLQSEVDTARNWLAAAIAAGRGARLTAEAALATEARVFTGAAAVAAGLADRVADPVLAFREFVAEMTAGQPAQATEGPMGFLDNGAPAGSAQGGTCRIGAGEALGRALEEAVGRAAEGREGDDARAQVVAEMAEAAGIEPGTVEQILAGEINCPPVERLTAFAEVLDMSVEDMIAAAEADGCDYSAGEAGAGDAEAEGGEAAAGGTERDAPAAGPAAERARVAAILDAPEARGREQLARHFALRTGMSPADAIAALAAAPRGAGLHARMQGHDPAPAGGRAARPDSILSDIVADTYGRRS